MVYDALDLIVPNKEVNAVFVTTCYEEKTKQTNEKCFDDKIKCKQDSDCYNQTVFNSDSGKLIFLKVIYTGFCLNISNSSENYGYCESKGWCSNLNKPLPSLIRIFTQLSDFRNFTIFIKSYVYFETYNVKL